MTASGFGVVTTPRLIAVTHISPSAPSLGAGSRVSLTVRPHHRLPPVRSSSVQPSLHHRSLADTRIPSLSPAFPHIRPLVLVSMGSTR